MEPSDLLTTRDVAELAGVSVSTVTRWADAGLLPIAVRAPGLRGAWHYRRDDVETFMVATQLACYAHIDEQAS